MLRHDAARRARVAIGQASDKRPAPESAPGPSPGAQGVETPMPTQLAKARRAGVEIFESKRFANGKWPAAIVAFWPREWGAMWNV